MRLYIIAIMLLSYLLGNVSLSNAQTLDASKTPDFSVRDIPEIMYGLANLANNKGFVEAGTLQNLWFGRHKTPSSVQIKEDSKSGFPVDWDLANSPGGSTYLSMKWVLDETNSTDVNGVIDNRYIEAYKLLTQEKYLFSELDNNSQVTGGSVLVLLNHIVKDYKGNDTVINFPTIRLQNGPQTIRLQNGLHIYESLHENWQFQKSTIDKSIIPLSPVGMVLGNFSFYAVPEGTAKIVGNSIRVRISSVGIYFLKPYRFHTHATTGTISDYSPMVATAATIGTDYLGDWRKAEYYWGKKEDVLPSAATHPTHGYNSVYESDYLKYGEDHNCGGDYVILSDIKIVKLLIPFEKDFQLKTLGQHSIFTVEHSSR